MSNNLRNDCRISNVSLIINGYLNELCPQNLHRADERGNPDLKTLSKFLLLTCATARVVHFELSPDLKAPAFIQAFKRFTARRNTTPKTILHTTILRLSSQKLLRDSWEIKSSKVNLSYPKHLSRDDFYGLWAYCKINEEKRWDNFWRARNCSLRNRTVNQRYTSSLWRLRRWSDHNTTFTWPIGPTTQLRAPCHPTDNVDQLTKQLTYIQYILDVIINERGFIEATWTSCVNSIFIVLIKKEIPTWILKTLSSWKMMSRYPK